MVTDVVWLCSKHNGYIIIYNQLFIGSVSVRLALYVDSGIDRDMAYTVSLHCRGSPDISENMNYLLN